MCDRCPNNFLKAVTYYHTGILTFIPTFHRKAIYNQPPLESDNEKLQKILKLFHHIHHTFHISYELFHTLLNKVKYLTIYQ